MLFSFQDGMGGDHRTEDEGAHVCEPHDRGMRLGTSCRGSSVSSVFILFFLSAALRSRVSPARISESALPREYIPPTHPVVCNLSIFFSNYRYL